MNITPKTAITYLLRSVNQEVSSTGAVETVDRFGAVQEALADVKKLYESGSPGSMATLNVLDRMQRPLQENKLADSASIAGRLAANLKRQTREYSVFGSALLVHLKKIKRKNLSLGDESKLDAAISNLEPLLAKAESDDDAIYLAMRKSYRILLNPAIEESLAYMRAPRMLKDRAQFFQNWVINLDSNTDPSIREGLQKISKYLRDNVAVSESQQKLPLAAKIKKFFKASDDLSLLKEIETRIYKLDPFYKTRKLVDDVDVACRLTRDARFQDISQRTFETIFSKSLIHKMPLPTMAAWDAFASALHAEFFGLSKDQRTKVVRETRRLQKEDSPRFWWGEAESLYNFVVNTQSEENLVASFVHVMSDKSQTGWHVAAKASVIIHYSRSMALCGFQSGGNALREMGDAFYFEIMRPRQGRHV